jgi:hypothetical protein
MLSSMRKPKTDPRDRTSIEGRGSLKGALPTRGAGPSRNSLDVHRERVASSAKARVARARLAFSLRIDSMPDKVRIPRLARSLDPGQWLNYPIWGGAREAFRFPPGIDQPFRIMHPAPALLDAAGTSAPGLPRAGACRSIRELCAHSLCSVSLEQRIGNYIPRKNTT